MNSFTSIYFRKILLLAVVLLLVGCSTGIEGTKTIRMTKTERRELMPTPEQVLWPA